MAQPNGIELALNPFDQCSSKNKPTNWQLAENHVARLLLNQGWQVHVQNYRWIATEIDILASKNDTLIAVEVKFRKNFHPTMQSVLELVPPKKMTSLRRGIQAASKKFNLRPRTLRVDLAVVTDRLTDRLTDRFCELDRWKEKVPHGVIPYGTESDHYRVCWYSDILR